MCLALIFCESDDRKGVKIVSVEDCQVAKAIDNIHLRPIMDMQIAYKNNFLFTASVDKKLIQYNLNTLKKQYQV